MKAESNKNKTTEYILQENNTWLKKRLIPEPKIDGAVYIYQRFIVNLN